MKQKYLLAPIVLFFLLANTAYGAHRYSTQRPPVNPYAYQQYSGYSPQQLATFNPHMQGTVYYNHPYQLSHQSFQQLQLDPFSLHLYEPVQRKRIIAQLVSTPGGSNSFYSDNGSATATHVMLALNRPDIALEIIIALNGETLFSLCRKKNDHDNTLLLESLKYLKRIKDSQPNKPQLLADTVALIIRILPHSDHSEINASNPLFQHSAYDYFVKYLQSCTSLPYYNELSKGFMIARTPSSDPQSPAEAEIEKLRLANIQKDHELATLREQLARHTQSLLATPQETTVQESQDSHKQLLLTEAQKTFILPADQFPPLPVISTETLGSQLASTHLNTTKTPPPSEKFSITPQASSSDSHAVSFSDNALTMPQETSTSPVQQEMLPQKEKLSRQEKIALEKAENRRREAERQKEALDEKEKKRLAKEAEKTAALIARVGEQERLRKEQELKAREAREAKGRMIEESLKKKAAEAETEQKKREKEAAENAYLKKLQPEIPKHTAVSSSQQKKLPRLSAATSCLFPTNTMFVAHPSYGPLLDAMSRGDVTACKKELSCLKDVNDLFDAPPPILKGKWGLMHCICYVGTSPENQFEMAQAIMDHPTFKPNIQATNGCTPLHYSLVVPNCHRITQSLLDNPQTDVMAEAKDGTKPLQAILTSHEPRQENLRVVIHHPHMARGAWDLYKRYGFHISTNKNLCQPLCNLLLEPPQEGNQHFICRLAEHYEDDESIVKILVESLIPLEVIGGMIAKGILSEKDFSADDITPAIIAYSIEERPIRREIIARFVRLLSKTFPQAKTVLFREDKLIYHEDEDFSDWWTYQAPSLTGSNIFSELTLQRKIREKLREITDSKKHQKKNIHLSAPFTRYNPSIEEQQEVLRALLSSPTAIGNLQDFEEALQLMPLQQFSSVPHFYGALLHAALGNNQDAVAWLLSKIKDLTIPMLLNEEQHSIFHTILASMSEIKDITQEEFIKIILVLKNHPSLKKLHFDDIRHNLSGTPLHTATSLPTFTKIAYFFLQQGCNPSLEDAVGRTPLQLALSFEAFDGDLIKALICHPQQTNAVIIRAITNLPCRNDSERYEKFLAALDAETGVRILQAFHACNIQNILTYLLLNSHNPVQALSFVIQGLAIPIQLLTQTYDVLQFRYNSVSMHNPLSMLLAAVNLLAPRQGADDISRLHTQFYPAIKFLLEKIPFEQWLDEKLPTDMIQRMEQAYADHHEAWA